MNGAVLGQIRADIGPIGAEICRFEDVRAPIVVAKARDADIASSLIMSARLDAGNAAVLRQIWDFGHIGPVFSIVFAHHDSAIVAAGPEDALFFGRLADG